MNGKICFVCTERGVHARLAGVSEDYIGGIGVQMILLGRELSRRGWLVSYVVSRDERLGDGEMEGIEVYVVPSGRGVEKLLLWRRWRRWEDGLRTAAADMYVMQGAWWQAGVVQRYCEASRRVFVYWIASDTDPLCGVRGVSRVPWWQRRIVHTAMRKADIVIAQTQKQASLAEKYLGRRAHVVPNVWPLGTGVRELPREPVVLWVANLRPLKRAEWVLQFARRLPEVKFVMVGGPVKKHEVYYAAIREAAARVPNVTMTGFLPFEEADRLFEEATVFLNTSSVEGFPNTYLQAWARGVPVIASFDPDGVIERWGIGRVFGSADEGVSALRDFLELPGGELVRMGRRAVEYVRANHSAEVVIGRLEAAVRNAMDGVGAW